MESSEVNPATEEPDEVDIVAPAPKTGLVATDPNSVNLISGQVQLVEAFAFW